MNIEVKKNTIPRKAVKAVAKIQAQTVFEKSQKPEAEPSTLYNEKLIKRMQELLNFEAGLRNLSTKQELMFFTVNETRKLLNARQCFFAFTQNGKPNYVIKAISSISDMDRNAPIVRGFEALLKQYGLEKGMGSYEANIHDTVLEEEHSYPFPHLFHLSLKDRDNKTFAALIFTREKPWQEKEMPLFERVEKALSYAFTAQLGKKGKLVKKPFKKLFAYGAALLIGLASLIPVPLSVLAPVEITAANPTVITAPFDGVIDEIYVQAGDGVSPNDLLLKMVDTDLVNRNKIAEQDIEIANSRLLRSSRAAYQDNNALQDLAIATSEYNLKLAEQKYAETLLMRSKIHASTKGVVLFGNKNDLIGKPVTTGERIMRIADPNKTEFTIEVALEDSIILKDSAPVRIFLDADPLNPIKAKVDHAALQADEVAGGHLAYQVTAKLESKKEAQASDLRIGLRGTAQILGEEVPLAFYLFRRPISAIRQWLGI